ncbi:MAG: hypothetical protein JXR89_12465 [Deltaproteobacteria bacterium]|nr:hypothetical protein [Deltaproteobacteria bacterium]
MKTSCLLTVIVVFFNMRREAERTLYTLTPAYQQEVDHRDYRVLVIDNGSEVPLGRPLVEGFGPNFFYHPVPTGEVSPVAVINQAVATAASELVMVMIDGAHMLSPGVIGNALAVARACSRPLVTVVGFHLGAENQNRSVSKGYNQAAEDELLRTVDWRENGYRLFALAGELSYDCAGWFGPLAESNCFLMRRADYLEIGGFDEGFTEVGGGLAILDFFRRALLREDFDYVVLLGEGSFHQFHGGVASNAPYADHPWERFHRQYQQLRGEDYQVVVRRPRLWGRINPEVDAWARRCAGVGLGWWQAEREKPHDLDKFFPEIGYLMLAARQAEQAEPGRDAMAREIAALKQKVDSLQKPQTKAADLAFAKVKSGTGLRKWLPWLPFFNLKE